MIGIIQLSYFGMAIAGFYRSPLAISLHLLKYSNGYNVRINSVEKQSLNLYLIEW